MNNTKESAGKVKALLHSSNNGKILRFRHYSSGRRGPFLFGQTTREKDSIAGPTTLGPFIIRCYILRGFNGNEKV